LVGEVASFTIWLVLVVCWVLAQPSPRNWLALLGLLVPLFVAWKHSIVRQDEHVVILARFVIFVMAVLLAETVSVSSWRVDDHQRPRSPTLCLSYETALAGAW
jgi:multisubunit Na+/H+ antiporter MnhE subunit